MKTLKLVFSHVNVINNYVVKHIVVHVPLIAAWSCIMSGAQTTLVRWTPGYWVSPESSYHCENNSHIILRPKRGITKKTRTGCTQLTYDC
jgi:hypothetical protein